MTPPVVRLLSSLAIYRAVWGLRLLRLRYLARGMCRRIWWVDRYCDVVGHRWVPRPHNSAAMDCERCHRKRLMLWNRATGETTWIVSL